MSGNALNFRVNVEAEQLKTLNTSITALRKNFIGLDADAKTSMAGVETSLANLNKVYKNTNASKREAVKNSSAMSKALRMEVKSVDQAISKSKALEAAKRSLTVTSKFYAQDLFRINNAIRKNNSFLAKNLQAQQAINSAQRKAVRVTRAHSSALRDQGTQLGRNAGLTQQFQNQLIGLTSIYAMERLLGTLIKVRGEFEIQNVALSAMLQNKALADRMFLEVQDMALKSPFKILDLNKSLKQLKAYRIENEKLVDTLGMLGDVSAGLGVGMDRLILAFGQIKATGWLRGTELRQLTEAGINVLDPLVEKFEALGEVGVTTADVMKKVENRMISFGMIESIFEDMTDSGGIFYKQQILQAETLQGKVSILTDAFHKMLNELGTANEDALKGGVDLVTELISDLETLKTVLFALISVFGAYKVSMLFASGAGSTLATSMKTLSAAFVNPVKAIKTLRAANLGLVASNKKVIASNTLSATSGKASVLWYGKGAVTATKLSVSNSMLAQSNLKVAATSRAAAVSMKAMKLAAGAILTVLGIAVTALITYVQKQKELAEEAAKFSDQTMDQVVALRELESTLTNSTSTLKERNKALKQAKELNADIIGGLNEQGRATKELTDSITAQIVAMKERAKLQAIYGEDYLKKTKAVEEAEEDVAEAAARTNEKLLDLLKAVESETGEDARFVREITTIFRDEDLTTGQRLIEMTNAINENLTSAKMSVGVKDALDEYGKISGDPGAERFRFDPSVLRGAPLSEQSSLEASFAAQNKIREIFDSFALLSRNAANNAEDDALAAGQDASAAYTKSFADSFGSMVEGDPLFGEDIISYISDSIFPKDWEAYQNNYIKEYFEWTGQQVTEGSTEWLAALESDSAAKKWSLNKFLVEQYGIGDEETLRKETRVWAKTVKKMITDAQKDIADFRENTEGRVEISQPVITQNIEAYRESIRKLLTDNAKAMQDLDKAAQNDPVVQKQLNTLYKNRETTFRGIANYLAVFDKVKTKAFKLDDYTSGLDNLLRALKAFKTGTEKFQKELDYTLGIGEGIEAQALTASEQIDFSTAKAILFDNIKETFGDTFFEGVYESFKDTEGDYSLLKGIIGNLTDDVSKIFTDGLTGGQNKEQVGKAVQEYYNILYENLANMGFTAAEVKSLQDKLQSSKQPMIDALIKDPLSGKDFDDLAKERDKLLGKLDGSDAFTKTQKEVKDIGYFDEKILQELQLKHMEKLKSSEDYIASSRDERLVKEKEITAVLEGQKAIYFSIKENKIPGLAKNFIDDAFGSQNLTQQNLSSASLTKLVTMLKSLKNLSSKNWDLGKLLKLEGEDLDKFNELNAQIKETMSLSGEDWDLSDAMDVMSGDLVAVSDEQKKLFDTYKSITDAFTPEQLELIRQLYDEIKKLKAAAQSDTQYEIVERVADIASEIGQSFSKVNDEFTKKIGEWISLTSSAIGDIVNGEGIEQASGIISLIMAIGNEIKGVWSDIRTETADAQAELNKGLAVQLSMESAINDIRRKRVDLARSSSAFYDPTYTQDVRFYTDEARIAKEQLDSSMNMLRDNAILGATGVGDRKFFNIDLGGDANVGTKEEDYSFSVADILGDRNKYDSTPTAGVAAGIGTDVRGMNTEDIAASFLDPIGVFGGGSSARAQSDAFDQVTRAFDGALLKMGKSVSDMTNFSSEEWLEFYTIIESAGLITDEATLSMIANGTEAMEAYEEAMEGLRATIEELAGTIYGDLRNSLVDAFVDGTYAAEDFKKALEGILEEMISTTIFNATFGGLFDKFQEGLEQSLLTDDPGDDLQVMRKFFEDANYLAPQFDAMMSNAVSLADQFNFDLFQESVDELGQLKQGITGMSEDNADILVGQFNSMRDALWRIYNLAAVDSDTASMQSAISAGLVHLSAIRNNTALTATATGDMLKLFTKMSTVGSGKRMNIN